MPESEGVRGCYGSITDDNEACKDCAIRDFCRDFAASERALAAGRSRIVGIAEWIPAATPDERRKPEVKYTGEDLLRVVRFFLTLSAAEFQILQLKLCRPELSNETIAEKLGIDRKRLYEFFKDETLRMPELKKLLYRQKKKRE